MEVPFKPLGITFLEIYDFSETTTDAFGRVKERYPGYDVAVFNIVNKIDIDLIHPDLIQEFLSGENLQNYEKADLDIASTKRAVGEGLVFSEGKKWKMKRKVLNAVFNFDFVKSFIPKITKLCDQTLDNFEGNCKNGEYNLYEYVS